MVLRTRSSSRLAQSADQPPAAISGLSSATGMSSPLAKHIERQTSLKPEPLPTTTTVPIPPASISFTQIDRANGNHMFPETPPRKRQKLSPPKKSSPARTPRTPKVPKTPKTPKTPVTPGSPPGPLPTFDLQPAHLDPSRMIPSSLTFSFTEAKQHLIKADPRFKKVFATLKCRPYENLESVDPFRSLCTSIVGQQVSWLAARAINHRFRRLFDPNLPEKVSVDQITSESDEQSFPAPTDVLRLSISQLKSAGLSTRKAEYVLSLAEHFESGQLSPQFLATASVEDVSKALIDIRGIGQWTVDMFLMFTLRRPNVNPVGDLGVQKGLLKWILAGYEEQDLQMPDSHSIEARAMSSIVPLEADPAIAPDVQPVPSTAIAFPPTVSPPSKKGEKKSLEKALLSYDAKQWGHIQDRYPLPEGLTLAGMKSRLSGKKAKGNVYLTPTEMEVLTENWKPYRSLAVYYMWAVAEESS